MEVTTGNRHECVAVIGPASQRGGFLSLGHTVIAIGRRVGMLAVIRVRIGGLGLGGGLAAQKTPASLPKALREGTAFLGPTLFAAGHLDVAEGGATRLRMQDKIRAQLADIAAVVVLHQDDGRGPDPDLGIGRMQPNVRLQGLAVALAAPQVRLKTGPVEQLAQGDPLRRLRPGKEQILDQIRRQHPIRTLSNGMSVVVSGT